MKKVTYFAVIEPYDGGYSVYFPDFLGCASEGDDFDGAVKNAADVLNLHIYGMNEDGEKLPSVTMPEKIKIEGNTQKGYVVVPITIYPEIYKEKLKNKSVKINVTVPYWLKEVADVNHLSYSQILQNGLKEILRV
jgi:predicted RNase H-like HicB family nuclease